MMCPRPLNKQDETPILIKTLPGSVLQVLVLRVSGAIRVNARRSRLYILTRNWSIVQKMLNYPVPH